MSPAPTPAPDPVPSATRQAYVDRVNRVIDHVVSDLAQPHRLEDLARVASFSPFHFHRVFASVVGEPPAQFVKRVRLERAVSIMAHNPKRSLTDIALDLGFSSSGDFSRSFKQRYGSSPSAFDLDEWRRSKRSELDTIVEQSGAALRVERLEPGENPDGFIADIVDLPERTMAYKRVLDPYREDVVHNAALELVEWAERAGVANNPWYGYMWDNPEVVELKDCRYDVAVEADAFTPSGQVGRTTFAPMRVAQLTIRGDIQLEMRALDWIYGAWLPASGYAPDDQPCFEAWLGRPFEHGLEHFELSIHLPIRRL